jgi:hypothetical protein
MAGMGAADGIGLNLAVFAAIIAYAWASSCGGESGLAARLVPALFLAIRAELLPFFGLAIWVSLSIMLARGSLATWPGGRHGQGAYMALWPVGLSRNICPQ